MLCVIGIAMGMPVSSAMPADNATYCILEAFMAMNWTEHIYSSTMEVIYENHERVGKSPLLPRAPGVPKESQWSMQSLFSYCVESS